MKLGLIISVSVCLCVQTISAQLLPKADNSFWRDSIPVEMRQSYIEYGEQYLGKPWTALPYSVFSQFRTNGNRVNYEGLNFEKRRQLAALVIAEIMEGEGRFMTDIIDGMGSFCEETWWGIPAHYGPSTPLTEDQTVDLFNAETANLIAWTRYMLQPEFDKFSPHLCQRIDQEIERRILQPAVEKDYWWKKAGMNWNPWICSNWLACVLICEKDETRKAEAIRQIKKSTQIFIDSYPEDGGCDEGAGYWDRAAASMFEVLRLFSIYGLQFTDDYNDKIERMASYAYKTYIGHDYCISFADAHENKAIQQVNIVYPFGLFLGDKTMCEFGAYLGRQKHILENPAALYDKSGNFPTLSRELFFLYHIREFIAEEPREPLLKDVWLGNLQIMTARRNNLYVAMKGGHNNESHLLIDPGVGEYTSKTFSDERYTIWTMQSSYHNLPQINGTDQKDGREYAAKVVNHQDGSLTLDIAGAYPPEADIKSWKRTVNAMESGISVTENYVLKAYHQPARLMFMTIIKPEVQNGAIVLGRHRLNYNPSQLEATIEDISNQLDPLLQRMWGNQMYRIILSMKSKKNKETIKYSIQ